MFAQDEAHDYTVRVKTSAKPFAGTDDRVFIQFIGTDGQTDRIKLDNKFHDDFERNKLDTFQVQGKIV